MICKAFLIHAKPGMAMEYQKRHNPIWFELKETLKDHGVSNYSIFLHQGTDTLFCYLEIEDEARFALLAEAEVCQKWWRYMTEVLVCDNDRSEKAKEDELMEVFYLA